MSSKKKKNRQRSSQKPSSEPVKNQQSAIPTGFRSTVVCAASAIVLAIIISQIMSRLKNQADRVDISTLIQEDSACQAFGLLTNYTYPMTPNAVTIIAESHTLLIKKAIFSCLLSVLTHASQQVGSIKLLLELRSDEPVKLSTSDNSWVTEYPLCQISGVECTGWDHPDARKKQNEIYNALELSRIFRCFEKYLKGNDPMETESWMNSDPFNKYLNACMKLGQSKPLDVQQVDYAKRALSIYRQQEGNYTPALRKLHGMMKEIAGQEAMPGNSFIQYNPVSITQYLHLKRTTDLESLRNENLLRAIKESLPHPVIAIAGSLHVAPDSDILDLMSAKRKEVSDIVTKGLRSHKTPYTLFNVTLWNDISKKANSEARQRLSPLERKEWGLH